MIYHFLVTSPITPQTTSAFPTPLCPYEGTSHSPTLSCPTASASYPGASTLHRTKGLSSIAVRPGHLLLQCIWSYRSLPVHSSDCGRVTGNTGWFWQQMLFFQWGCNAVCCSSFSASSSTRFPELSLMVGSNGQLLDRFP